MREELVEYAEEYELEDRLPAWEAALDAIETHFGVTFVFDPYPRWPEELHAKASCEPLIFRAYFEDDLIEVWAESLQYIRLSLQDGAKVVDELRTKIKLARKKTVEDLAQIDYFIETWVKQ